jgi:type I restriction enzyme M protein
MNDDRFSGYGKLAPSSKADFAFVQHMVHQLDDNGTIIVLPHGFRGGAEGHIRQYLIKEKITSMPWECLPIFFTERVSRLVFWS